MVHKIDHSTLCWSMRGRYSLFTIDIYDWLVSLLERALVTMFSIRSAGRVVFKLSVITAKRSIRVGLAYVTYPPRWIYVIMRAVKLYIFHLANDVQQIFNGRLISSWSSSGTFKRYSTFVASVLKTIVLPNPGREERTAISSEKCSLTCKSSALRERMLPPRSWCRWWSWTEFHKRDSSLTISSVTLSNAGSSFTFTSLAFWVAARELGHMKI